MFKARTSIFMTKKNRRQAIGSILPSSQNNKPMEPFQPNKPKGQRSFWEVNILGWFAIIGYTFQNTLQDQKLH